MKKQITVIVITCILILGVIGVVLFIVRGKKPYKNLDTAQIASATVRLSPPDKTIQITDINELVKYLKDAVIYNKDNSYTEYSGQGVIFTLTMSDGMQTEIMAYNPFLVIDGVGYKTKYEPCEALNSYANRLLDEKDANIILEEPPGLAVISDNTSINTLLGSYLWQKMNADGTATSLIADGAHPLDCKDMFVKLETTEQTASLNFFEKSPDRILNAECWSDRYWNNPSAVSEDVEIDGNEITLKPDGYIYEIRAEWDTDNGYGGTAYYSFYIDYKQ